MIADSVAALDGAIDLMLLHSPGHSLSRMKELNLLDNPPACVVGQSWRRCRLDLIATLQEAQRKGLVVDIGVSNFDARHLAEIEEAKFRMPSVNQIELSPLCPMEGEVAKAHERYKISVMAYSPLGGYYSPGLGKRLREIPAAQAAAQRTGRAIEQVLLRYLIQKYDAIVIPSTSMLVRMRQNLDLFGWSLNQEEIEAIAMGDGRNECAYPMYQSGQVL